MQGPREARGGVACLILSGEGERMSESYRFSLAMYPPRESDLALAEWHVCARTLFSTKIQQTKATIPPTVLRFALLGDGLRDAIDPHHVTSSG
jgi:hypothetical protein